MGATEQLSSATTKTWLSHTCSHTPGSGEESYHSHTPGRFGATGLQKKVGVAGESSLEVVSM